MAEKEFKLLSLREESKLTPLELEQYYEQLREYVLVRKLQTTTLGALTIAPKLKKIVNIINRSATELLAGGKIECITDGTENIPAGGVLFANNHQGILDNICWTPSNPRHSVLLHASDTNKLLLLIQHVTGLVLVNKNDPNDHKNRTDAKLDMIHILMKGHTIWYFPEGTWNMSPNKLHLPMSFGFLEVAKKAGVPVVPVATDLTYDTSTDEGKITRMHIRYGKPIYVSMTDDLSEKLEEYEAALSTLRWELMEEKGMFHREQITEWDYINYLKGIYKALETKDSKLSAKAMADRERRSIRGASDDFYLFHHINDVPFNDAGELLDTEENIRLEKVYQEHFNDLSEGGAKK